MADIVHRIGIHAPAAEVYKALTTVQGLGGWWTDEVQGTESVGGKIEFQFRSKTSGQVIGVFVMEVRELAANRVAWRCLEGPAEWIGTNISFDLSSQDGQTIVLFAHKNWKETVEFMYHCSMKWAIFMLSLRELVETGKGKPSPDDIKIDNWN
jgi:uncharacterized protein YndB with AHSA1/START domain